MLPFCGYNFADYWSHWLSFAKRSERLPKIFHVNWFRRGEGGEFLWPGFGDNLRELLWIIERVKGKGEATESPIGYLPTRGAINTDGLDITSEIMEELNQVDREAWAEEMEGRSEFFKKFGDRLPAEIQAEHDAQNKRLQ